MSNFDIDEYLYDYSSAEELKSYVTRYLNKIKLIESYPNECAAFESSNFKATFKDLVNKCEGWNGVWFVGIERGAICYDEILEKIRDKFDLFEQTVNVYYDAYYGMSKVYKFTIYVFSEQQVALTEIFDRKVNENKITIYRNDLS